MCASAVVLTELPEVEYAAADPVMDDVANWLAQLPFAADRLPVIRGPAAGHVRLFAELLPVLHMVELRPQSRSLATYRARRPELVQRAEELLRDRRRGTRELRGLCYPSALEALTRGPGP